MKCQDFANMLADDNYWYSLIDYQVSDNDFDADEFFDRLIIEANFRGIDLTDKDDFDFEDYWWDLTQELTSERA